MSKITGFGGCIVSWTAALLLAGVSGCAGLEPANALRVGHTESQVVQLMGAPAARHTLPEGAQRLEFARGPAGRTTWMVDLDTNGRVRVAEQVLNEASFQRVVEGLSATELQRLMGRPGHRSRERGDRETWSWRYPTNDCLWFRVTLSAEGRTTGGGGYMPDPACDVRDNARGQP